eukprot:962210-Prorocentrum_minimum.AAC.1
MLFLVVLFYCILVRTATPSAASTRAPPGGRGSGGGQEGVRRGSGGAIHPRGRREAMVNGTEQPGVVPGGSCLVSSETPTRDTAHSRCGWQSDPNCPSGVIWYCEGTDGWDLPCRKQIYRLTGF